MDEPPPLEDCSGFLKKLHSHHNLPDSALNVASTTITKKEDKTSLVDIGDTSSVASIISNQASQISKPAFKPKPLRRGFFSQLNDQPSPPKKKEVPFITAKRTGSKIPDFLHVKAEDHPHEKLKQDMKDLLKPTEELVNEVMNNSEVKAGLEDPEVMLAVQDIASNPDHIDKYRHHPKVVAFYSRMGKLMSDQIEKKLG
ncbi:unnamed protein product [Calypogeia fissa]